MSLDQLVLSRCVVLFSAVMLSACAGTANIPFSFDDGKLIVRSRESEVATQQKVLASIREGRLPREMSGAVVFNGRAIKRLPNDRYGQPVFAVKVQHVYQGPLLPRIIMLTSPRKSNGGVMLVPDKRYRIMAVDLGSDGRFYIWAGTVVPN